MAGRSKKDRGIVDDGLNEATIVRSARDIIVQSGVDGLTMRRLSDALGVALGATYHYVPNRGALLRLVAQDIYSELQLPRTTSGDWADHIHKVIINFVRLLQRYPGMSNEVMRDPTGMSPAVLRTFVEERLTSAGFRGRQRSTVMAAIFFYVTGATAVPQITASAEQTRDLAIRHFEQGLRMLLKGAAASMPCEGRTEGERRLT
jgi:AcrR family transcriptional regulator